MCGIYVMGTVRTRILQSKMSSSAHRGYLRVHVIGLFNQFIALPNFNLCFEEIITGMWCKNKSCVTAWTLIHILDSDPQFNFDLIHILFADPHSGH
jgi:hypothetical protein